jgi:hypothetical protein
MQINDIQSTLFSDSLPPIFVSVFRQSVIRVRPRLRLIDREIDSAKTKFEYLLMGAVADVHSQAVEYIVLKKKEVLGPC